MRNSSERREKEARDKRRNTRQTTYENDRWLMCLGRQAIYDSSTRALYPNPADGTERDSDLRNDWKGFHETLSRRLPRLAPDPDSPIKEFDTSLRYTTRHCTTSKTP